jgi:hypothetical protein
MVEKQKKNNAKPLTNQRKLGISDKNSKIGHSIPNDYCGDYISPFGDLLGLV